jgi:hypothetical protein
MVSLHGGAACCRVLMTVSKQDLALTRTVGHRAVSAAAGVLSWANPVRFVVGVFAQGRFFMRIRRLSLVGTEMLISP